MSDNEGRLKALIEIVEKAIQDLQQKSEDIALANMQIRQAARDVDELRYIVGDVSELIESSRKTTWMTTTELAAELKVDEKTVRRWWHAGRIRGYKLSDAPNGQIRFDLQEVNEDIRRSEESRGRLATA